MNPHRKNLSRDHVEGHILFSVHRAARNRPGDITPNRFGQRINRHCVTFDNREHVTPRGKNGIAVGCKFIGHIRGLHKKTAPKAAIAVKYFGLSL
jgi:hypothetical protein